ncbi:MAG: 4Fe-4S dicluster domain-containing protein [Ignavibacteria bacterium]|nr:4Fe-4S dicluster domain-containing protein [Ignavibacteria bacterium]
MATFITEECINCGACEPECPNTAIYVGAAQYEFQGGTHDAISNDFYYIVPLKCTECVGHFDQEQCAAVCPVDCCVPDPNHVEAEELLYDRAKQIHPERPFSELSAANSRFRKG